MIPHHLCCIHQLRVLCHGSKETKLNLTVILGVFGKFMGFVGVGWTTNFWILIMIYCLLMSIIAGVIHTLVMNQLTKYRRDDALVQLILISCVKYVF